LVPLVCWRLGDEFRWEIEMEVGSSH
jgi:hypothetical protein